MLRNLVGGGIRSLVRITLLFAACFMPVPFLVRTLSQNVLLTILQICFWVSFWKMALPYFNDKRRDIVLWLASLMLTHAVLFDDGQTLGWNFAFRHTIEARQIPVTFLVLVIPFAGWLYYIEVKQRLSPL